MSYRCISLRGCGVMTSSPIPLKVSNLRTLMHEVVQTSAYIPRELRVGFVILILTLPTLPTRILIMLILTKITPCIIRGMRGSTSSVPVMIVSFVLVFFIPFVGRVVIIQLLKTLSLLCKCRLNKFNPSLRHVYCIGSLQVGEGVIWVVFWDII